MDSFLRDATTQQCIQLLLSGVAGVLLYSVLFWIMKKQRNTKAMMTFEPNARAVAAGVIVFACLTMALPHIPDLRGLKAPPVESLYILVGVAIGVGLVAQMHRYFDESSSNSATAAMLAHGATEGVSLGLLVGSSGFHAIFQSQVLHGVPEGVLMAMVSLDRSGFWKTIVSTLIARSGLVVSYYATVKYMPPISNEVLWSAEGVAIGSMAAVAWEELIQPANSGLGKKKATAIIAAVAALCFYFID